MPAPPPIYHGTIVRRITAEPDGLSLWLKFPRSNLERRYTLTRARALLTHLPDGILRNELTDALRLCDTARRGRQ